VFPEKRVFLIRHPLCNTAVIGGPCFFLRIQTSLRFFPERLYGQSMISPHPGRSLLIPFQGSFLISRPLSGHLKTLGVDLEVLMVLPPPSTRSFSFVASLPTDLGQSMSTGLLYSFFIEVELPQSWKTVEESRVFSFRPPKISKLKLFGIHQSTYY